MLGLGFYILVLLAHAVGSSVITILKKQQNTPAYSRGRMQCKQKVMQGVSITCCLEHDDRQGTKRSE